MSYNQFMNNIADDVAFLRRISVQLPMFKEYDKYHFGYRCLYCGDSNKNSYKTRGSIFPNPEHTHLIVSCFNCKASRPFFAFLKDVNSEVAKEYQMRKFKKKTTDDLFESLVDDVKPEEVDIPNLLGLIKVFPVSVSPKATEYLRNRFITSFSDIYFTNDALEIVEKYRPETKNLNAFKDREAIVFPLMTIEKAVYGIQMRFLEGDFRYLTIMVDRRFPKCYGLHEVDLNQDIWVTEGIFDAKMFDNNLANLDSALHMIASKTKLPKSQFILAYDNEPRNKEVMQMMKKGVNEGYRVFIWPSDAHLYGKDFNDIRTANPRYFEQMMSNKMKNVVSGLKANLAMKNFIP